MHTCGICNKKILNVIRHLKQIHEKISYQEYFFKYLANYELNKNYIKCEACNTYHTNKKALSWHIKHIHDINSEEYYLTYILKTKNKPICLYCNKPSKFRKLGNGFTQFCDNKCQANYLKENPEILKNQNDKSKKTNLKRHGVPFSCQLKTTKEKIKESYKKTMQEKYKVDNYFQTNECKEKIKNTCIEKYGREFASQSEEVKNQIKQTCKEKYGVESPLQNKKILNKVKETNLKKYGKTTYTQTEEYKQKLEEISSKQKFEEKKSNNTAKKKNMSRKIRRTSTSL